MKFRIPYILAGLTVTVIIGLIFYYGFISDWQAGEKKEWQAWEANQQLGDMELQRISHQIESVRGKAHCTHDEQCKVVGLGMPVCGNYPDYLIYSTMDSQEGALLGFIGQFNSRYHELNNLKLSASSCGSAPATVHCGPQQRCEALQ